MYRTLSGSALDGKHFTGVCGNVTLAPGESSKNIDVSEKAFSDVPLQYRYQGTNILYYYFELYDHEGDRLTALKKTIASGGTSNNVYYLNNIVSFLNDSNISNLTYFNQGKIAAGFGAHYHDSPYTPPSSDVETSGTLNGYVLIDDSYDYRYKSATVNPGYLFVANRAGATGEWHKLVGNKLYASVVFTEKEKNDGYAYVQILIGDGSSAYDTGADPNAKVNTPVNSIYKACFELKEGSGVYDGNGKWVFPHSYDHNNQSEQIDKVHFFDDHTAFWMDASYLWQQQFRSESYRAGNFNNAFILDPDISGLTVRFDCGGSDDDTYGYKDLFVRWALVDGTAPTVLKNDITISPGLHGKGNYVTISIPFSEPVVLLSTTSYILHTSWGALTADPDCDGSNVVSFSGVITANPGTALTIDNLEMTYEPSAGSSAPVKPIKDLLGNEFGGDVSKSLNATVEAFYNITYDLKGGSIDGYNPGKYSNLSSTITLINPTRVHYCFAGWTGTGLDSPTMTVTIPSGSTGDRSYTATWTPDIAGYWAGEGTQANPYVISTAAGLEMLAALVEDGSSFSGKYFELGSDIDMSGIGTFNGIGTSSRIFYGTFDGKGHSISNFTITANGQNEAGLFRYKQSGAVKNVAVNNATINGAVYAGGVVGYSKSTVSGCTVKDCIITASATSGNSYAGGVIGYATVASPSYCNVANCSVTSNASNGNSYIGGIIAYIVDGDVTYCNVDNCSLNWNCNTIYSGGIVGFSGTNYSPRSISYNVVANCNFGGTVSNNTRIGTFVGWLNGNGSISGAMGCSNNFILNTVTPGDNCIYGLLSQSVNDLNNHYRGLICGTDAPVHDVYTLSAGSGITVSGTPAVSYAGTDYYSPDTDITVSAAPGFTLANVSFTPEGGMETQATDNGNGSWSFTTGAEDIIINSVAERAVSLVQGAKGGARAYWSTFFNSTTNFELSEGAAAYTLGSDYKLYCLGANGRAIPKNTAVVIIATSSDAAFTTAGTANLGITDHAVGGNKLQGSDSPVPVAGLTGTPYVLGKVGDVLGFYRFTGTSIPAGKAYYVVPVTP